LSSIYTHYIEFINLIEIIDRTRGDIFNCPSIEAPYFRTLEQQRHFHLFSSNFSSYLVSITLFLR
jgi:hypothetical protein